MRGHDLGSGLTAVLGGQAAEGADDVAELVLAAVAGKDAEEVGGDRIELKLRRERGKGLAGFIARDQRAGNEVRKIP